MFTTVKDLKEIKTIWIRLYEKKEVKKSGMCINRKNEATEIRNLLDGLNSILDTTIESIRELEKRSEEITQMMASERWRVLKYETVGLRRKKIG